MPNPANGWLWPRTNVETGKVIRFGNENPSIDAIVNSANTTVAVRNAL